ncbi:hypothetical protein RB597_007068 [Gaeumannomyces tritici]
MAPSAVETVTVQAPTQPNNYSASVGQYKELSARSAYNKDAELKGLGKKGFEAAKYPHYLPTWNPEQKYPPLEPFTHVEHGKDADPSFAELLPPGQATATHLTPTIGTEVRGVQLSRLSDAGRDQLARYVAERRVVAFRDQDLADLPIADALDLAGYFGRHHVHPTSGSPEGHPEVHLVHREAGDGGAARFFEQRTTSVAWHSDVSYEAQPPGTTFLYVLDQPDVGGDTLFADCAEAYARLSPLFRERLHGLTATHSGVEQVNAAAARGGIKRREPVVHSHPIVRTHPVTGEKALYVNPQFTRDIDGLKKEESDAILKFLYEHIAWGADFHARVKWEKGTVVVWDNRVTQHSALVDWKNSQRRHLARLTPQAERPYETLYEA